MQLFRFIPIALNLFLILGILLGKGTGAGPLIPLLLASVSLLLLYLLSKKRPPVSNPVIALVVAITGLAVGTLSYALTQPENRKDHYLNHKRDAKQFIHLKILEVWKPGAHARRYRAIIKGLDGLQVSGQLLVSLPGGTEIEQFQVDDELLVWTRIDSLAPPLNPHQFSYKAYLEGLGIYQQLRLNEDAFIRVEAPSPTLLGFAAKLRNTIVARLREARFGKEALSVVQALLLGQRNDLSSETYEAYKNAGAVHLLAVSGLHIGILLWLLHWLLAPLEGFRNGKSIKLILLLVLLWGYALLAGLSASILRAVSMFSFVAYALYLNRPTNTYNILALSMFFVLLAINPRLLFQAGFQMSYAAVVAIVWIYPLLQKLWSPRIWLLSKAWQLLSVSLAAQLGVLPISLYYFHQFPGLFFVTNLLVIPFLGLVLGLGFLVAFLALFQLLPPFLALGYEFLIDSMNGVVSWVARQEAFLFQDIYMDLPGLLLAYLILGCLGRLLAGFSFRKLAALLSGILLLQLYGLANKVSGITEEKVWIIHQSRQTVLVQKSGSKLLFHARPEALNNTLISDFRTGERASAISRTPLQNAYRWKDSGLYIMDSDGLYLWEGAPFPYLLLTNSPRIHLKRLLEKVRPQAVIADGSNYPSFVARWAQSCREGNIPFHYTATQGAYLLDIQGPLTDPVH